MVELRECQLTVLGPIPGMVSGLSISRLMHVAKPLHSLIKNLSKVLNAIFSICCLCCEPVSTNEQQRVRTPLVGCSHSSAGSCSHTITCRYTNNYSLTFYFVQFICYLMKCMRETTDFFCVRYIIREERWAIL